jgi:hypothetical protein
VLDQINREHEEAYRVCIKNFPSLVELIERM